MIALPFILPPKAPELRRVGTPATGILEFPVLGGLTVAEASYISDILAQEQSSFVIGARVADALSKAKGISISEAFGIIEGSIRGEQLEPEAEAIRLEYAAQIQDVARVYSSAGQRSMSATVTAMIRHRLNMPTWTLEDTNAMHRSLFNAVWQLAEDEQAAEAMDPPTPPDEETLGKPPEESGPEAKPTGAKLRGS